jgi:hypothetical protein
VSDAAKKKDWEMGLYQDQPPEEPPPRVPVTWTDGAHRVAVRDVGEVVAPSAHEIGRYGDQRRVTCASCKKFDLTAGQKQMHREGFVARLVHEMSWKVKHMGAAPETMGLCGETNGDRLTSMHSAACAHYRPRREAP